MVFFQGVLCSDVCLNILLCSITLMLQSKKCWLCSIRLMLQSNNLLLCSITLMLQSQKFLLCSINVMLQSHKLLLCSINVRLQNRKKLHCSINVMLQSKKFRHCIVAKDTLKKDHFKNIFKKGKKFWKIIKIPPLKHICWEHMLTLWVVVLEKSFACCAGKRPLRLDVRHRNARLFFSD